MSVMGQNLDYKPPREPSSPLSSFNRQSSDKNDWSDEDDFGFYVGYLLFFGGYIYITIAVLYDIIERGRGYEDDIKHDLDILH